MFAGFRNRVQFLVERFLVRGPWFRLLFVIGVVAGTSLAGGLAVMWTGQFDSPGSAIWWAFLRLTDPGYLGDDQGAFVRTVSTILTVTGYVLFLGALIAIMTQWLQTALRRLENGLTPIADRNHFVVVGWTTRTPAVVRELLLSSERVRHFLRRRGKRSLNVVVMAEEVDAELQQDMRERVGEVFSSANVILRSGSALRMEHLRRVAALDASALILPAPAFDDPRVGPDTQTIKTLLSLATFCRDADAETPPPLVVVELVDARNLVTARRAYPGPIEAIATDHVMSSLICQNIRHPGLSHVYTGLLTHGEGSEIYARDAPPHFVGKRFGDLVDAFPSAILLGLVRRDPAGGKPLLNPSDDVMIVDGDRLVLVAESLEDTDAPEDYEPKRPDRGQGVPSAPELQAVRRILVLGWSHLVPRILEELDTYRTERFEVVVGSMVPTATRAKQLEDHGISCKNLKLRHVELDFTIADQLRAVDPPSFDNVVFVASDRIEFEEADARTILGHLLLREIVGDEATGPDVLVELADPENLALFQRGSSEVIIPATLLSHMLAQIALRPELRVVFDDLFGPHGPEIFFRPAEAYGLVGREVDFETIRRAVADQNETPLGLRFPPPGGEGEAEIVLNPDRNDRWKIRVGDELIVVATYES